MGGDLWSHTAALHGSPPRRSPLLAVGAMQSLRLPEALAVFNWLDKPRAAEVLDELDPETVRVPHGQCSTGPHRAELLDHLPSGRRLPMKSSRRLIRQRRKRYSRVSTHSPPPTPPRSVNSSPIPTTLLVD